MTNKTTKEQNEFKQTIKCSKCGSMDVRTSIVKNERSCKRCGFVCKLA